ncbi:MAG: glycosyltransferase family 4 protein [Bacteroidales bacterium]|nr:glycosyltransferase family 4 protein [Bacteroidales bacterium]
MKVVVTGTRGIPDVMGGVETCCEELCPRLAARGVDVTVVRRSSYVHDGLSSWKGVTVKDIPAPRKKAFEAAVHTFRAVNYAAHVHADIVHINAVGPALLVPYAKLLGLRVVFTHHGPDYEREKWGRAAKGMLKLGERLGVKYADDVTVISDVIRDIVQRKYGRTQRVHLIHNGVPVPDVCDEPAYFAELGIESEKFILGMSRFVPEKHLHDLVAACEGLAGYKLVLAGDTDFEDTYSRKLKAEALAAGVVLTGFIRGRKLHSLLSHAACFVLPSSHEGLPIALLEAMSYGRKVLVSDIPANLEVGLSPANYFACGDVAQLRSRLEALLADDKPVTYDMSAYNWDHIAGQYLRVYESQDVQ